MFQELSTTLSRVTELERTYANTQAAFEGERKRRTEAEKQLQQAKKKRDEVIACTSAVRICNTTQY